MSETDLTRLRDEMARVLWEVDPLALDNMRYQWARLKAADALLPLLARMLADARAEALREAAEELAAEARLLKSGPGDRIRRTTLNIAAKNLRRRARAIGAAHRLRAAVTWDECADPTCRGARCGPALADRTAPARNPDRLDATEETP